MMMIIIIRWSGELSFHRRLSIWLQPDDDARDLHLLGDEFDEVLAVVHTCPPTGAATVSRKQNGRALSLVSWLDGSLTEFM